MAEDNEKTTRQEDKDLGAAVAADHEAAGDGPQGVDDGGGSAEARSAAAFTEGEDLGSSAEEARLLSFYDNLRERILEGVEHRGGKLGENAVKTLLLVPDVFILLVRLALDKDVPASARTLIGGALAYFILPIDLLPEALMGVGGYVDDMVLAVAVLTHAFSGELEPYARKHWSGTEDLRKVMGDVAKTARSLMSHNVYAKLRNVLKKRGVDVDEQEGRYSEPEGGGSQAY